MQKNLVSFVAVGVVVLVVAVGFYSHFSGVASSQQTGDNPVVEKETAAPSEQSDQPKRQTTQQHTSERGGIKELTKEKAAKAIEQSLKTYKDDSNRTDSLCQRSASEQGFESGGAGGWYGGVVEELEKAGFVKITSRRDSWGGDDVFTFTLTENMRPYLTESPTAALCKRVIIGEPDKVEVTELIEAGIEKTEKTIYAKATVKYKSTPIGDIINKVLVRQKAWAGRDELIQRNFVLRGGNWYLE